MFRKTTPHSKQYVLTNDPSITAWGWAVVDPATNAVVEAGAIKTEPTAAVLRIRKGDDRVRRVMEINRELIRLLTKYKICLILSELPHGSQSATAAQMIGMVTGMMQSIGDCFQIPVEWFSEGDAKKAVSGARSVPKDEMVVLIDKLWKSRKVYKGPVSLSEIPWKKTKWENQAIADCLAVYYSAWQQSTALKMIAVSTHMLPD